MSVTIAPYQHLCLLELHLTSIYDWICCKWLASISVVVGGWISRYICNTCLRPSVELCPYARTQPQHFQLYRLFSILWHLSLHLFLKEGTFTRIIWYYGIIRSNQKWSGKWCMDLMDTITRTKTKNNITKNSPLFFPCCSVSKQKHVIPHPVIAAILDIILNILQC